jgi:hypothetical protein
MSDRDKDAEILGLRHQIMVLERQLGNTKVRFDPADRAFLAALLNRLPKDVLRGLRLLVRPDTVLRWHRDLIGRRHAVASRPKHAGGPRTLRSIRILVLRLARETPAGATGTGNISSPASSTRPSTAATSRTPTGPTPNGSWRQYGSGHASPTVSATTPRSCSRRHLAAGPAATCPSTPTAAGRPSPLRPGITATCVLGWTPTPITIRSHKMTGRPRRADRRRNPPTADFSPHTRAITSTRVPRDKNARAQRLVLPRHRLRMVDALMCGSQGRCDQ